jgi:EAL domain-containing protein (putative c-di-GMP-specific phosphodiesterase class I)
VGDEVIRITASRIQQTLRQGDRLYRLGGDEFATFVLECGRRCAERLAERCLQAMRQEDFSRLGIHEPVNLSIGIALANGRRLPELSELKRRADMAMYHAKRPGTRRICFHESHMDADRGMLYSSQAIHAVQQAVRHGEGLEMHYQPIVDLSGERIAFLEALVRLRGDNGLFQPGQFLPIVEAHRLEEEFDFAILRTLQQELERGTLPAGVGVSLNLSANGLLSHRTMKLLESLAASAGSRPLLLEITESTLITRLQDATRQIGAAHELGYQVALDDFGSGYSSLRYLASMLVEMIKFDISMTRRIVAGGRERHMIQGIVQVIGEAGFRTVAEGIEDPDALSQVRKAGFTHGQGYLFGRPVPSSELPPGMAESNPVLPVRNVS